MISIVLEDFSFAGDMTPNVETALVRSLNRITDRARTKASREARDQINFPASYLSPNRATQGGSRLFVKTRAKKGSIEASIEARSRPTSLARFTRQRPLTGGARHRGGQVNVQVKPGVIRGIKRAFVMRLKNSNFGLAVRTDGAAPKGAWKPKMIEKNLWLLYGPSVAQVMESVSDGDGVYEEISPEVLEEWNTEFLRQLDYLENK